MRNTTQNREEENYLQSEKEKRIWRELAKDGIHNEKELDEAIKKMKPLNIGGFVNRLEVVENENC